MKKLLSVLRGVIWLFLFFFVSPLQAQTVKGMHYQAVARDANGALMPSMNVNLRFEIREASANGSIVYAETQSVMTNPYSLFSVVIGEGTASIGLWSDIPWGEEDYYLHVEVNGAPVATTKLQAVPYSKVSTQMSLSHLTDVSPANASGGNVLEYDGNQWVAATDNVEDGDADPNNEIQQLSYNNSTLSLSQSGGSVTINSSPWTSTFNQITYNNGAVGIGTNNPAARLHLADLSGNNGDIMIQDNFPFLFLRSTIDNNSGLIFQNSNGAQLGLVYYRPLTTPVIQIGHGTSGGAPNLIIDTNGRIGLNTTTPDCRLQLVGTANTAQSRIMINALEIQDMGSSVLGIDGDITPFFSNSFDLGNNTASQHWDDVVANDFVNFSDRRTKHDIQEIGVGLDRIMLLRPIQYRYRPEIDLDQRLRYGLIAQEVEPILPNIIITDDVDADEETGFAERSPGEYKGMSYLDLIPVLIQGMQEQQAQIEQLQARIQQLESTLQNQE